MDDRSRTPRQPRADRRPRAWLRGRRPKVAALLPALLVLGMASAVGGAGVSSSSERNVEIVVTGASR
jgi:hypothetical protein